MPIHRRLTPEVAGEMREEIAEVDGAEVLWVGRVDSGGVVVEVSAAARGTPDTVPALFPHMTRGDVVIHNHPNGELRPSGADLAVASRLGNQGIGFLIVDNAVEAVRAVAEPVPRREIETLEVDDLAAALEPEGRLAELTDDYEPRPGQVDLLRFVSVAFNNGTGAVAEAGTGTGKSFAYLIPAVRWAARNDERVVVSTATIALQQQLMEKDIPLALRLAGENIPVALVKGRGNYLCLKRLEEAGEDDLLFQESTNDLAALKEWSRTTSTGDLADVPFRPRDSAWARVRCEADSCAGPLCPLFDRCFLMRARRGAAEARLLVANHHLLFADLAARAEGAGPDEAVVLPPYGKIVVDEAHHVESSATSLFTNTLSLPVLRRLATRLFRRRKGRATGLLVRWSGRLGSEFADILTGTVPKLLDAAIDRAETLDALSRDLLAGDHERLLDGMVGDGERSRMSEPMEALRAAFQEAANRLGGVLREIDEEEAEGPMAVEARQAAARLQETAALADSFVHREDFPEKVFWLETRRFSDGAAVMAFHRTPLEVASLMRESIWEPYGTVVSLSATLAVGGRFDHWLTRVGANDPRNPPQTALYPSPFDFATRVLLGIPVDGPSPENAARWESFLVDSIASALDLVGGHALVLFTSFETLKKTRQGVEGQMGDRAPRFLAQGDDDRGRLLKTFRNDASSVLFATDSFWEGVDVPGEALRLVILTRLPFRPPGDPVSRARREAVAAGGENPFLVLTLPEAVTRFRQGFGRLMRRTDDRGAVLVLDSRIVSKSYGELFVRSLPETRRSVKPWSGVLRDLEDFLFVS